MKAYQGNEQFGGGWDEYLDNGVGVFEALSNMCDVSEVQMLNALPIMLKNDEISYFSTKMQQCTTYPDSIYLLKL